MLHRSKIALDNDREARKKMPWIVSFHGIIFNKNYSNGVFFEHK